MQLKIKRILLIIVLSVIAFRIAAIPMYTNKVITGRDTVCAQTNCTTTYTHQVNVRGWPIWYWQQEHLCGGIVCKSGSYDVTRLVMDYIVWVIVISGFFSIYPFVKNGARRSK